MGYNKGKPSPEGVDVLGKFKDFVIYQTATGLSTGLSPYAPGTVGSLLGLVLLWLVWPAQSSILQLVLTVGVIAIAIYTSNWYAETENIPDPAPVVIDEIAGVFVTFLWIPAVHLDWTLAFIGFALFRIFDIWKPWPIRRTEKLPGGVGIVADDVVAGLMANLVLHLGIWIF